jgi:hypothetical protein
MGGQITPDERLQADNQQDRNKVQVGSGALRDQWLNAVVPGSKEAGNLEEPIPDPIVRQYVSALGEPAED